MFRDSPYQYPDDFMSLGRYLGPSPDVGSHMTYKILKFNGEVVHRSTLRPLTDVERASDEGIASRLKFDANIAVKLGPKSTVDDFPQEELTPSWEKYADDDPTSDLPEAPAQDLDPVTPEINDSYLNVDIMLPRGDTMERGRVVNRKRDSSGDPIGRAHENPILDSRRYDVEWNDGHVTELTANVIAQSMYAQCDPDGNQYVLLDGIVDFRKNNTALSIADQKIVVRGRSSMRRSTVGWQLCCQWKDKSTSWEKLSDLKESHPLETAEYATAMNIDHEPAFNWWAPHVLKKRDRIISLVKQRKPRYLKRTHKFGIEVPKSAKEAFDLDKAKQ